MADHTRLRIPVEHDNADIPNSADFLANVTPPIRIRCGDHVLHRPSGETWVVAYADYGSGDLSACGWPDSIAKISDCDLVKVASELEHRDLLAFVVKGGERRGTIAKRLYCSYPAPAAADAIPIDAGRTLEQTIATAFDKYSRQLGWGLTPYQPECWACLDAAVDELAKLRIENARLREALTPSGDTKAAYMGEFYWKEWVEDEGGQEREVKVYVHWTTIKEIMKAISDRAGGGEA